MGEEKGQGITRRDLLRRGAVLGGAVVWTTPVVQTLGMGRAFAQTTSPTGGKDISYLVIAWECDGVKQHTKVNENGSPEAGATPDCEMSLEGSTGANLPAGFSFSVNGPCVTITAPSAWCANLTNARVLLKAGSESSTTDPCQERALTVGGTDTYCTA